MEYLSIYRYLSGTGGWLVMLVLLFGWLLYSFIKEFDPDHPLYYGLASMYIGLIVGTSLLLVSLPILCHIRSIALCFRVM